MKPPAFEDVLRPLRAARRRLAWRYFFDALVKAGVPSELHVFAKGSHGSGLGKGDAALDQWSGLLENWLRPLGLLTVDQDAVGAKR